MNESVPAGRGDGLRCYARACVSSPSLRNLDPGPALSLALSPAHGACWWIESDCVSASSCGRVCCAGAGRLSAALTSSVAEGGTEGRGWRVVVEMGYGCESGSGSCRCLSDYACYCNYKKKKK